jgi:hypothetical protein
MRRGVAVILAASMMVMGAMPVLADDRQADQPVRSVDSELVRPADRPADAGVDPVGPEVVGPTDRSVEIDRYRCVDFVNDRRCIDDRHPHVNLRHLIHRLINAGEWEKLFRLLHRLGII